MTMIYILSPITQDQERGQILRCWLDK